MAIFYMSVQIIGRSAGRTATGAAAYRAGERIVDERTGQIFDYARRRGEIETQILSPAGSPAWVHGRAQLWNAVEKAERRSDAQVAREIVVAFPKELSPEQHRELVRGYVAEQFVSRGMVADVAIHRNPGNPHAHIMLTMREMGPEGLSNKKNREWNKPEMLETWREQWSTHANRALERAGLAERIDHRSLAEQGSDRLPQVHLGPDAAALERRGLATEKGNHNRLVADHNAVVLDLQRAREERRRLEMEKAVSQRYAARMERCWPQEHARALAQLEYDECGGRAVTPQETADLFNEAKERLKEAREAMVAIEQEGRRLERAAEVLRQLERAAAEVKRFENPVAAAKRWFSSRSRREYSEAQSRHQQLFETAVGLGVTSEGVLGERQASWEQTRSGLPALGRKVSALAKTVERAAKALEGFRWEWEREHESIYQRRRQRSRDLDRGR